MPSPEDIPEPAREPEAVFYAFDEYKLYYESTEKITDRRLAAHTWYYSICAAVVVAIGTAGSWALSRPELRLGAVLVIIVLSAMGVLLCSLWRGQIRDFKALNNAKFKVLNDMAGRVQFGKDDKRISARPFVREWEILTESQSARRSGFMGIIAMRATGSEFALVYAFQGLFVVISALFALYLAANWREAISNPFGAAGCAPPVPHVLPGGTK